MSDSYADHSSLQVFPGSMGRPWFPGVPRGISAAGLQIREIIAKKSLSFLHGDVCSSFKQSMVLTGMILENG